MFKGLMLLAFELSRTNTSENTSTTTLGREVAMLTSFRSDQWAGWRYVLIVVHGMRSLPKCFEAPACPWIEDGSLVGRAEKDGLSLPKCGFRASTRINHAGQTVVPKVVTGKLMLLIRSACGKHWKTTLERARFNRRAWDYSKFSRSPWNGRGCCGTDQARC